MTRLQPRNRLARVLGNPRLLIGVYALLLFIGLLGSYALTWHRGAWPSGIVALASLLLPSLAEILVFWCIGRLLLAEDGLRGHPWRTALFLANALTFSVLMPVQCYALVYSNSFISVLALENVEEARLAASASQPILIGAAVLSAIALTILCRLGRPLEDGSPFTGRRRLVIAAAAVLAAVSAMATNRAAPVADGAGGLNAGQSPVAALLQTGWEKWRIYHYEATNLPAVRAGERYPYMKEWINRGPLPFRATQAVREPNVLVFFIEGMSARVLGPYGGAYPDLTPNLDALAHDAMVVDNYYNHTAATYRGLQGQMTSGYPRYGGSEGGKGWMDGANAQGYALRSYSSLSGILHGAGYHTVFFTPHPESSALNSLVAMLGFDEKYNRQSSMASLLDKDPVQPFIRAALTDHDLFLAVRRYLERWDRRQPLFLGLYNIGTHAFLDVDAHGEAYGDGSNHSLNTIHNLDAQFGEFYRWFIQSPYAKDTLLVFTSDHAHYPEPSYVRIAGRSRADGGSYDPYFVDRIPMLVRAPWLQLPPRFDAHDRTSLDFAPTILSLLHIERAPNSFLGLSLFRPFDASDPGLRIAPLGPSVYAIYRGRVYAPGQEPASVAARYEHEVARSSRYHAFEAENRIFPPRSRHASTARPSTAALARPQPAP